MQQSHYASPHPAPGSYEFNELENQRIEKLSRRCQLWGVFALISGVLGLLGLGVIGTVFGAVLGELPGEISAFVGFLPKLLLGLIPLVLINLAIGVLYIRAGKTLMQVVTTQGNDIPLILAGVQKLGKAFKIEAMVSIVALALGLIGGIVFASYFLSL